MAKKIKQPQRQISNLHIKEAPRPEIDLTKNDYPLFCFKHLADTSIKGCRDAEFFSKFLLRLQKLSALGWDKIRTDKPHGFGMERIPKNKIKPKLPPIVTPDVKGLDVFRSAGDNRALVGMQDKSVFRVLFIETRHGDIYRHN